MNADFPDPDDSGEPPPDFDAWEDPDSLLRNRPIRERMLDVIVQIRTPTTVAEIAGRVDCDTETARDYLEWFATMGIATEHPGRPVRYERNRSYLRWRRIERLRRAYTDEELVARLERSMSDVRDYRERFDAARPEEVSLLAFADEADADVESVWEALSAWKTVRERAELLDAARRGDTATDAGPLRVDG